MTGRELGNIIYRVSFEYISKLDAEQMDLSDLLTILSCFIPVFQDLRQIIGGRHYPTLPSSEIATSCCASMANSIGSACSTSLQKPLTTSATASSSSIPRERQ